MVKVLLDMDEVFTLEEAAAELRISIATLFRWMKAGKVFTFRLSGRTLVPASEVERLRADMAKRGRPSPEGE